ncbi:alpha-L-rhamnosidase [Filimonas lacunae]|uniref:alpha-L-rhamnosidase n=2 Tax=Filimonas lacunae TaxID=477680 RepID=A0A173MJN2_9BACT|nr:alpha-L-rhamnosidase [Filimonas lacunae]SIT03658.1 alpha-L-rhamnosidase [Filimonas lacunae]
MIKPLLLVFCCLVVCAAKAQLLQQGAWITNTEDTAARGTPYFRKVFSAGKPVAKATLEVCGVGYHMTYVNGKPVTSAVLEQGYTRYDKRLLYTTYDITALLQKGENCLAAELGNGWYNAQSYTIWFFHMIGWRKTPRLLAALQLEYADGSKETIVTDNSWKCTVGPGRFNSMHAGEIYDARKEIPGWNAPGLNDASWQKVMVTSAPGGMLEKQDMPSAVIINRITPVSVTALGSKRWLYDMGQNFAGVVTLQVQGKAGDTITLHYGEVLNADGSINLAHNAGQMMVPPGDLTFQTDKYIVKGDGVETYTPRFTYHGFQYVQVETDGAATFDKKALTGLFYSTDFTPTGSFSSSDTMLNKLYKAAIQSYRSNFISIPTDCPQREKMGWTADAHIAAELGLWNFDAASGYRKWLRDLRDVQLADGNLPGVAPTLGRGYHWTDRNDDGFGPAWGSALPLVTWYLYMYGGDTAVVRENYAAIKLFTERMRRRANGFIYNTGFGDWVSLQQTPVPFISTAYFYSDTRLLSKMAAIVGEKDDARQYALLADSIGKAFNDTFLHDKNGLYGDTALTALSGALFHGLCPPALQKKVAERLAAGVQKRNYHADFGVLGTKYVLPALSDNGYADIAYRLLTDTGYAGWGHWIANGATTLYEDWPGAESHNHVFFGDYGAWFFKSLAGIRPDESAPGFQRFTIQPVFPEKLEWIKAAHTTRYGVIEVEWRRVKKQIKLGIQVPPGTTAVVKLPGRPDKTYRAGKYLLAF